VPAAISKYIIVGAYAYLGRAVELVYTKDYLRLCVDDIIMQSEKPKNRSRTYASDRLQGIEIEPKRTIKLKRGRWIP